MKHNNYTAVYNEYTIMGAVGIDIRRLISTEDTTPNEKKQAIFWIKRKNRENKNKYLCAEPDVLIAEDELNIAYVVTKFIRKDYKRYYAKCLYCYENMNYG